MTAEAIILRHQLLSFLNSAQFVKDHHDLAKQNATPRKQRSTEQ